MYLSGRERRTIELLLSKQEPTTIKTIAKNLEVSERTVHRDLKNMEDVLSQYELRINKRAGVGVSVLGDDTDKKALKHAIMKLQYTDYTPDERQSIILTTLLETREPIKLFHLASELNVTIATISHDLDMLEEIMTKYELNLIRRRGYGVKIDGAEENKRAAISYLISKHVSESEVIQLLRKNIEKEDPSNAISNRLLGMVDQDKLTYIEQTVNAYRANLPYELADSAYVGLVVHLALAMERLQKGERIQFDPVYLKELQETKEYKIAHEITFTLEEQLQIEIPNDEIGYVTMHLLGAKLRNHEYLMEESSLDIAYKAKQLISFVSNILNKDLLSLEHILDDLVAHLKPAIYRLQQGMNIKNPLMEEIESDYHQLFFILEEGTKKVFPDIHFPKEEIAYLVLHFASALLRMDKEITLKVLVVCSSGIGTSKMLASKIIQQIPEITEIESSSLFDLENRKWSSYDFIISTVPIKHMEHEYILASPILTTEDIHKINSQIRKLKMKAGLKKAKITTLKNRKITKQETVNHIKGIKSMTSAVISLLEGFYLQSYQGNQALAFILQEICKELEEKQVITDAKRVAIKLQERADLGGLGIPNTMLALFHTRSEDIMKPSFTIHPLAKSIIVQGMDGNSMKIKHFLIMLSPINAEEAEMEILSFISSLLIRNQESTEIFQSEDQERIGSYLAIQLHQFIKEKLTI